MITWKEFKEGAEAHGVKDADKIMYIDFSYEYSVDDIFFDTTVPEPVAEASSLPPVREWRIWS